MVQRAQRQTVRHDLFPLRMPIRQDVSRVEQLLVPQMADRAAVAVRPEHPKANAFLMESPLRDLGDVLPPPLGRVT